MITLKCKMCGGTIEVSNDQTIGTCEYCGSTMTLPRIESEKKARLFNRANDYRINCEFDKAYDTYRMIVDEDEQEAEAYWGMLLSEYGVEYVEDPKTKKRIPTCHRTQIKSIKSQTNYELACKYADSENKMMYQDEAEELNRIQKSILSISNKEEPYDVFICYKETDTKTGNRTVDSVLAQDIYDKLTEQGLRVFFSRITLEDKLGKDYEPYIFSALTSAKVMLVIATNNEHIESTWVKNEWLRYLRFMNEDKNKVLVPVYKDMQINELPDELNKFQGQDMNKVGAIQDLCRSIKKLVKEDTPKNSDEVIDSIKKDMDKMRTKQKKRTLTALIIGVALLVIGGLGYRFIYMESDTYKYDKMNEYRQFEEYEKSMKIASELNGYGQSESIWKEMAESYLEGYWATPGSQGDIEFIYHINKTSMERITFDYENNCMYGYFRIEAGEPRVKKKLIFNNGYLEIYNSEGVKEKTYVKV